MKMLENKPNIGQITQINSNLAIVKIGDDEVSCKIRGILKHKQTEKPLVGDFVEIDKQDNEWIVSKILPRYSYIIRPNVANIDVVILTQSIVQPDFNFHLLMKLLAYYELHVDEVILVFTKNDIADEKSLKKCQPYLQALKKDGYQVFSLPNDNEFTKLKALLQDKTFCLAGNSGVGKTNLTNQLFTNLNLKTQEISFCLNRGKHTTTAAKLICDKHYKFIDTPGFSSIDINLLTKQQLANSYKDFRELSVNCKFSNCLHIDETSCAIKVAVEQQKISSLRYEQYLKINKEIKTK